MDYWMVLNLVWALLFGLAISLAAGVIVFRLVGIKIPDLFANLVLAILAGVLLIASIYAIIKTGGRTMSWGNLMVLGFMVYEGRKVSFSNKSSEKSVKGVYAWVVITPLLVLLFFYFRNQVFITPWEVNDQFRILYDDVYRSQLGYFNSLFGRENMFHVFAEMDGNYLTSNQYHYFELWWSNLLWSVSGIHYVAITKVVVDAFWCTILVFIFSFLLRRSNLFLKSQWLIPFSLLLLFFGPTVIGSSDYYRDLPFYDFFNGYADGIHLARQKYQMLSICVLIAFFLINQKQYGLGVLMLTLGIMLQASALFGILFGTGLFLILLLLLKEVNLLAYLKLNAYLLLSPLFLVIHQRFFADSEIGIDLFSYLDFSSLQTKFNFMVGMLLSHLSQILLWYLVPFIILLVSLPLRNIKTKGLSQSMKLSLLAFFISVFGSMSFALFFDYIDAKQFYLNIVIPVWSGIMLVLLTDTQLANKFKKAGIFVLLLSSGYHFYIEANKITGQSFKGLNQEYKVLVAEELNRLKDDKTGYLVGASFNELKTNSSVFDFSSFCYTNGHYLPYIQPGVITVNLSECDYVLPNENRRRRQAINSRSLGVFYNYVEKLKVEKRFSDLNTAKRSFIEKHQLKYAIFSNGNPDLMNLSDLIAKKIVNEVTGEVFVVFEKD